MPSQPPRFYAVRDGRETGVFLTWAECEKQIKGFPGAIYRRFENAVEAAAYVSGTLTSPPVKATVPEHKLKGRGQKRAMPEDSPDESTFDVVYCDGACKGNGKSAAVAGVGVWWGENDSRNIAERCPGDQTNNRAELIAVIRMLETTPRSKKPLLIKTDSKYTINCVQQWIKKWTENGFRTASGEAVKNSEVVQHLSTLINIRGLYGQVVQFCYVKGHSGNKGNDGADKQANLGALLPPLPERDWLAAKRHIKKQAEEEHKGSLDVSNVVPMHVVSDESETSPPKRRKISHESYLIKSSPSTKKRPSSESPHFPHPSLPDRSKVVTTSPISPLLGRVGSAKPGIRAPNATMENGLPLSRSPTSRKSSSLESISRKHGAGFFKNSSPQSTKQFIMAPDSKNPSRRAKDAEILPSICSSLSGVPLKPISMSVNQEDVNFEDYVDCLTDDDDLLK